MPAVCASLARAPLADNSCAAVTMFHVLEHLYDPSAYLDAAHRLLKPGGRLIVQVPNAASWQFLLLGENWTGLDVPRHLIDFRARDLETLLDHCGFEVVRTKHFSLRDNPAGLATSLAPWLDPMVRRIRRIRGDAARAAGQEPVLLRAGGGLPAVRADGGLLPCRIHHHGGGAQETVMIYRSMAARLPKFLRDYVLAFETRVEREVGRFRRLDRRPARACSTPAPARAVTPRLFARQRYVGVDLGVGDAGWNYRELDVVADLAACRSRPSRSTPA